MIGIFFDCETTGLNPKNHRILDLAFRLIDLESGEEIASFASIVYQDDEVWEKSNPESLAINGFTREIAVQGRREKDIAADIIKIFEKHEISRENAVFICQNPSFDRVYFSQLISPDLQEEKKWPYHWLDLASMHWGRAIATNTALPWATGISKDQIAAAYGLPPESSPHRAQGGVDHLLLCYEAVVGFPLCAQIEDSPSPRN